MSRIGISPDQKGYEFIKLAASLKGIEIEGIFTHFKPKQMKDKSSSGKSDQNFSKFLFFCRYNIGLSIPMKHCSNSAGIVELKMQTWIL